MDYIEAATSAPIKAMLDDLDLTRGRGANWGIVMRGSKRKLTERDMRLIAAAMGVLSDFDRRQD